MKKLTPNQARVLAFIQSADVASSKAIAEALRMRISDASLSVHQLENLGLVDLSFTRINRSKSMAHASLVTGQ